MQESNLYEDWKKISKHKLNQIKSIESEIF